VSPDGKTVYVASQDAQEVIPISTSTNKAGKAIKLNDDPLAIAIARREPGSKGLAPRRVPPRASAGGTVNSTDPWLSGSGYAGIEGPRDLGRAKRRGAVGLAFNQII
jgi:YVTN family beta-propeller protein